MCSEEDTMEKSSDSVESSPSDRRVLSEKGNLLGKTDYHLYYSIHLFTLSSPLLLLFCLICWSCIEILTLNRVILVTGGHGGHFEGQCVLQMQDMVGSYSVSGSPNHSKALRRYSPSAGK